jgi:hypothetical protein
MDGGLTGRFCPSVTYLSGKRVIRASSEAAADAVGIMGNRTYLAQVSQTETMIPISAY